MAEPHRLMRPGLCHQEALAEGGRQSLVYHARWFAGGGLQQAHFGSPAKAGHRLHHLPGRRRHRGSTRGQQPGSLRLAQVSAHRRRIPPPPGGRRGQHAVAAQRVEQLQRLIRIAMRVRGDHLGQARRRRRVHVEHLRSHGDKTRDGQVCQPQVPHSGLFTPPGHHRCQWMRWVQLAFPVRAHQQQAVHRLLAQHQVDGAEWRAPRPLQVIDEHHHRPFPRGDRPQQPRCRPLRPDPRGQRIPRIGRHRQQRRELRQHRGQQARVRPNRRQDPPADLGQLLLRLGQQQPAQRAKRLMNRVELQVPPVLVELARHEPALPAGHHRPQLIDQRRLTHPRRAADQHPPAPARRRVIERRLQRRHLVIAAHQPRRRQQPQRNITLADPQPTRRRARADVPQPLQVIDHAVSGLVPVVRFLLQQMHDDRRQRPRHGRVHLRGRHRHSRQVIMDEPQRAPGTERRRPRRQLIQRRAQRVQVRPLIHCPAGSPGLLRRQIRQRPHGLGVMGELRADLRQRGRQREVHQARVTVPGEHDVRRSEVPVHHPPAVHPRHRRRQLHRKPDQVIDRYRLRQPGQARAAGVRHHDRPRIPRRLRQLRDPLATAQPLQHRHLMPQPAVRVWPQRLLADDRAPGKEQPGDRACAHSHAPFRPGPAAPGSAAPRLPPSCTPAHGQAQPILYLHHI